MNILITFLLNLLSTIFSYRPVSRFSVVPLIKLWRTLKGIRTNAKPFIIEPLTTSLLFAEGVYIALVQCSPTSTSFVEPSFYAEIIVPAGMRSGDHIPLVVRAIPDSIETANTSGMVSITSTADKYNIPAVNVKRGIGSCVTQLESSIDITVSISNNTTERRIRILNDSEPHEHSGVISENSEWWDASHDHIINTTLLIDEGITLHIAEGTRVLLGETADIIVRGELHAVGTIDAPVIFISADWSAPWGGIEIHGSTASFTYCFFVNGGANSEKPFYHANCQPLLLADTATISLSNCFFIDNIGKGVGSLQSVVTMQQCCIARCATGGEFQNSIVDINNCHISDIPNGNGLFIDNDNDGLYFCNRHPSIDTPSKVTNTTIITGKDDAIDHNNALLIISDCWLEGFLHEGVAASEGDTVSIINTVVKGCEQGIEAGYGSPVVCVDHCVVIDNDIGVRFGDSYDLGCSGKLSVINTILYNNNRNIYNFDKKTTASVDHGIEVSYSIVNDDDYAASPFCIQGTPRFDDNYYLMENSAGYNAGIDHSSMGLIHR